MEQAIPAFTRADTWTTNSSIGELCEKTMHGRDPGGPPSELAGVQRRIAALIAFTKISLALGLGLGQLLPQASIRGRHQPASRDKKSWQALEKWKAGAAKHQVG
ncbi:hypothetical protein NZK27_03870 [Synechococcus sp. FGCU-3]|nr:hypothetical protein [Synechococcus sp. FGCU3]